MKLETEERTVYFNLVCIKNMAKVVLECFDEAIEHEKKAIKEKNEFDLSHALRAITGAAMEAQELLDKGKIK